MRGLMLLCRMPALSRQYMGAAAVCLLVWGWPGHAWAVPVTAAPAVLRVGVAPGPEAEVMRMAVQVAAARGVQIELVTLPGGDSGNALLAAGKLDAVSSQDGPAFQRDAGRYAQPLQLAARTVTLPMALYSRRAKALKYLARGATIALPADPEGTARALILLHNYGLITYAGKSVLKASSKDVTVNRYGFRWKQLPDHALAAALDRYDLVVIRHADALKAGLQPGRDALGIEDAGTPFARVLAVRTGDAHSAWVQTLATAYQSPEVKQFILKHYQDSVRRPW